MTNGCYLTQYNCRLIDYENNRALQLGQSVNSQPIISLVYRGTLAAFII